MAIAAILYERRLERRLHAGDLGQIDVAPELSFVPSLEVEIFNLSVRNDGDPGLLWVGRIDQHELAHEGIPCCLRSGRRARALSSPAKGWESASNGSGGRSG